MEASTLNAAGPQMEALCGILRDIFRPLVREAVASALNGRSVAPAEGRQEYLSAKEVEAIYGLNSKTLSCWRSQGKGPTYSKKGNKILYRRQDVEDYLKNCRVRTIEQPGVK